jgi:HlyD family secretion protein
MLVRIILSGAILAGAGLAGHWYVWPVDAKHYAITETTIAREILAPGVLAANRQVMITARTLGFLSAIKVDRNDGVAKGQVLAVLESAELQHQLAAAEAKLRAAEDTIKEAEIERDRASLALQTAQQDFDRQQQLFLKSAISAASFDAAKANLQNAKALTLKSSVVVEQALAMTEAARAEAAALAVRLSESDIRSPINGVVVSRSKTIGDLLAPGAELFEVVDTGSIIVSARFDESTIALVEPGQAARVSFSVLGGTALEGSVLRVGREVDPETREYAVEIALAALPDSWAIGQRATVTVVAEAGRPGIAIPQRLLVRQDGRVGVFVLEDGRARWKPVELGYVSGTDIEVRKGLDITTVVLDPDGRFDFQRIREAKPAL